MIRSCYATESGLLAAIHRECFPHYWNPAAFTDFFSIAGTYALLMEKGGPQGMLVYRVQHEQADIITLAVLPEWRRCGIAKQLVDTAIKSAASIGAKQLFLDVEDGNEAAINLYERFGFQLINRRKLYYRQKDGSYTDALVMMRKLD